MKKYFILFFSILIFSVLGLYGGYLLTDVTDLGLSTNFLSGFKYMLKEIAGGLGWIWPISILVEFVVSSILYFSLLKGQKFTNSRSFLIVLLFSISVSAVLSFYLSTSIAEWDSYKWG